LFLTKNVFYILMLAGIAIFCFSACSGINQRVYAGDSEKVRTIRSLAVLPFANHTGYPAAGEIVSDLFATGMITSDLGIKIIEQAEVLRNIGNNNLGADRIFDRKAAIKIGKGLKADAVIYGSVTEFMYRNPSSKVEEDPAVAINIRIVDVDTGIVIWAGSYNGGTNGSVSLTRITQLLVGRVAGQLRDCREEAR
jgi:TolB-like protein